MEACVTMLRNLLRLLYGPYCKKVLLVLYNLLIDIL